MDNIVFKEETYKIIGCCFDVYNEIGNGFLESVYQECLEIEFQNKGINYECQKELKLIYKSITLQHKFKPDFICYDKIIIELKSVSELCDEHRAQILNYLKISNFHLGLLINFGAYPKLEYERFAMTKNK